MAAPRPRALTKWARAQDNAQLITRRSFKSAFLYKPRLVRWKKKKHNNKKQIFCKKLAIFYNRPSVPNDIISSTPILPSLSKFSSGKLVKVIHTEHKLKNRLRRRSKYVQGL